MFVVHPGSMRVFAAGNPDDNALYYSEIGNPAHFASAISKVYPSNGYGRATALGLLSRSVIVSYENGWYAWDGITPIEGQDPARWSQLNIPAGCVCHRSLALTPNSITYLGKDGIYMVSSSILNEAYVLTQSADVVRKVTANRVDAAIASIANPRKCRGVFHDGAYYLAYNTAPQGGKRLQAGPDGAAPPGAQVGDVVASGNGDFVITGGSPGAWATEKVVATSTGNTRALKLETASMAFSVITGWRVNQWVKGPESLCFATRNYLLATGKGHSDVDPETGAPVPINMRVRTKEYPLGGMMSDKFVRLVCLFFRQTGDGEALAGAAVDGGGRTYRVNGVEVSESLAYGRAWGLRWGFRETAMAAIEYTEAARAFQVELESNAAGEPVTLLGVGFVYSEAGVASPTLMEDAALLT
jgi:hypothetical protein